MSITRSETSMLASALDGEAVDVSAADHTLENASRGLYIGSAGNVKVLMKGGTTLTFTALAVGVIHPLQVTKVFNADTTADDIVALY